MPRTNLNTLAFEMPGGEDCQQSTGRPVDLKHLENQTFGDRALEQEVLGLFVTQVHSARETVTNSSGIDRARICHGLKGSARGIGAFEVAQRAEALEKSPDDSRLVAELDAAIVRACDFIATISR